MNYEESSRILVYLGESLKLKQKKPPKAAFHVSQVRFIYRD
jgi:hypothetical protein